MKALVLADHNHQALSIATRSAVTAAKALAQEIHVLVAGHNCLPAAQEASSLEGVAQVLHAEHEALRWPLAENIAPLVTPLANDYTYLLTPSTSTGKDIMPRIAALLDVAQVSDVIRVVSADTFVRPIYAGNALQTVKSGERIHCLTIRPTAFGPAADGGSAPITSLPVTQLSAQAEFIRSDQPESARPDLAGARIIIAGGRGIGSAENFRKLEQFADRLGAAVGASRAAVDAGFAPNDLQIGQTGKVVAPDLYIAVGISGAIQHLAGMKDSKTIVAINKDENAPIFAVADYGLVADWQEALPVLEQTLGARS